ncbi:MAG: tRNA pseudouridine(38-40) synthase TruA [Melioribacteraceae bacterium]|nr:tRNA pseudouridine(38-40) synthase TruA [Melioribacteraceae bacterium]MCF8355659.1 tRNA pseudouridine(38-40) synthase TruA [Melioribacteraceae bacterium]MCF8395139.1 tRNA pseudouridine(38-40) synthase TruA [Melioribacteraceae bacterium]MCF8420567.1 tRNA pseudouridine(38-40) synthase TruA [Melioribacteraceae bacterium]
MNNYRLTIQYDGTDYAGWQIQKNAKTVQGEVTNAIQIITKGEINLIGSGRTDSGVHSLGQVANFRINEELDIYKFKYSLNGILPQSISVTDMKIVPEDFHSRFDAKKRSYIYLFSLEKSPFFDRFSWMNKELNTLDIVRLNKLSKILIGNFDFSSFVKKEAEVDNKICDLYNIHWRRSGALIIFYIEANRFLHGMVRAVIGTIIQCAKENYNEKLLSEILSNHDRESAGMSVPANGLFLYKVKYD